MAQAAKKRNRGANDSLTNRPQGPGKRLTLSEKLVIRAERKAGKSYGEISKEYNVGKATAKRICDNVKLAKHNDMVERVKKNMANKLYLTADSSIDQVNKMLPDASAAQAAVITGIMIEKARLIDGQSTANQSVHVWMDLVNSIPVDQQFDE
jgi:hypothetical protein